MDQVDGLVVSQIGRHISLPEQHHGRTVEYIKASAVLLPEALIESCTHMGLDDVPTRPIKPASEHVRAKLMKVERGLHDYYVLDLLLREGWTRDDIDQSKVGQADEGRGYGYSGNKCPEYVGLCFLRCDGEPIVAERAGI